MKHVATAAVLLPMLVIAVPMAMARTPDPMSHQAARTEAGTYGVIAPRLPTPDLPEGASPQAFLNAARSAVVAGKTGLAEEALERAQTRALDITQIGDHPIAPMSSAMSTHIDTARSQLKAGDRKTTLAAIDAALALTPIQTSSNATSGTLSSR